ncbi:M48 family metalloprotease [Pseudohongiella acticola]|jgi:predicted Zn-dependent protease|uniref:M48 family metalloprotease n=1 Tax=Pseudohongiella acticola TaxID=1524254 RepID=UPI0030ECC4CE
MNVRVITPLLSATLVVILGLQACAVNPATGQPNLVLMSESRELEIGEEEHEKVLASMRVVEDRRINDYVSEVGQRVAQGSHRGDLEYTFTVIDSPEINAFALPGGYVYINRGLLLYLKSEDELAAVLAHEVGHITARHAIQQQARGRLGNAAATVGGVVAAVATGSGYIGSELAQIGSIWAAAGVSGFGRDNELEADSLGAEYLYNAGYNPRAMIDVLSVLKNQEDFNVRVAQRQPTYHGLFTTHPRNDVRLQQAVAQAGNLPDDQARESDHNVFRGYIDGLLFGENTSVASDRNRYYQDLLSYTMVFPDDWEIVETTTTVQALSPQDNAIMLVEAQRLRENKEPRLFIRENLGITDLQQSENLNQYRLLGHTGMHTNADGNRERIAVFYLGPRVFVLRAEISDTTTADDELEDLLFASMRTFRPIQANERSAANGLRVRYVQVTQGFSWAALAARSPVQQYPEETLRLLNGYYPIGTPQQGEWIKILQ